MFDYEETQLLDGDPDANSSDGCSHLSGETLEVEDSILSGETQAVDDEREIGYAGTETQLVDDRDNDGVDSDASTDDGDGNSKGDMIPLELPQGGSACKPNNGRSIASVPATPFQSSGLSAAHMFSISNSDGCNNHSNVVNSTSSPHNKTSEPDETKNSPNDKVAKKLSYESPAIDENISYPKKSARLSYVQSQEPGEFSQANALNVVDDFLTINFLGLSQSQEANNIKRNDDLLKSPPVSSKKGSHILVKSVEYMSPVGKQRTFEWIDNLEDEGGGEFFTKRKDSFFNNKGSKQKSHSVSLGKKGARSPNHKMLASLARSDSRFLSRNLLVNDEANMEKTREKKNLLNDLNDQSDLKSKKKDSNTSEQGTYEVGPDTQMAAEVLGELVYGPPLSNDKLDVRSTPISKGVSTRSKSKLKNLINLKSNVGAEKNLVCTNEKSVSKRGKRNNKNETNASFVDEVGHGKVGGGIGVDDFRVNLTPIAHRTRHSKVIKPSDAIEKDTCVTTNVRTRGSIGRQAKSITDGCGSSKPKRKHSDMAPVQNIEAEKDLTRQEIECQLTEDAETHPKRKRMKPGTLCNSNDTNYKAPSPTKDSVETNNQKRKIVFKTISDIMDAAKRKRRSFSTCNSGKKPLLSSSIKTISPLTSRSCIFDKKSDTVNLLDKQAVVENGKALESIQPSNDGEKPFKSSVRTRSSLKSHLHTAYGENGSKKNYIMQEKQGAVENGKYEESLKQKHRKNVDAASPICIAEDNVCKPMRPRSFNARVLTRLETQASSPTSGFNTRKRREMSGVRVFFSNRLDDDIVRQQKKIMGRLGVPVASSVFDATHFVTDSFVRTKNMLEAMALGKPVVTHLWLENCGQASCFIDEKQHIMRDAKKEKEIGFSMPVSLDRACQKPLLEGRRVYVTKNIKPSREIVSSLVKAARGQPLERLGRLTIKDDNIFDELLVLSCEEDYAECIPFLERGAEIFSSELLLNGIVIQKLEYTRHRLFLDHVRKTRSTIWVRQEGSNENDKQFRSVTKCI